ncbi:MAG: hypothetical protein QM809_07570 [Gordonia sp. (in: high G+C Gram-positive bacteria)]|uniref:hypothetical protein n=1 Tax=Gordonia sp. (in: high G+C Gram-positive bacteria) TaxID=84139 RepID=UPI0039E63B04
MTFNGPVSRCLRLAVSLILVFVSAGCSSAVGDQEPEKPEPVLGRDGFQLSATGFGAVKPAGISLASTAASTVGDLMWESWGGEEAVGRGLTQNDGAGNPRSTTWVLASDLGWCEGRWAYRELNRSLTRETLSAGGGTDICQGNRAEPSSSDEQVTLNPDSLLTFGGVGGVYLGDRSSKIPATYVDKEVAGVGLHPTGTEFYYFRPQTSGRSDAYLQADPDGTIVAIRWYATDKGIRLGSTRDQMASAYEGHPHLSCWTSGGGEADFYRNEETGRLIGAVFGVDDEITILLAYPRVEEGEHCPFE